MGFVGEQQRVGRHFDGRTLVYDSGRVQFAMDSVLVAVDSLAMWDGAGEIIWDSPDMALWFRTHFLVPSETMAKPVRQFFPDERELLEASRQREEQRSRRIKLRAESIHLLGEVLSDFCPRAIATVEEERWDQVTPSWAFGDNRRDNLPSGRSEEHDRLFKEQWDHGKKHPSLAIIRSFPDHPDLSEYGFFLCRSGFYWADPCEEGKNYRRTSGATGSPISEFAEQLAESSGLAKQVDEGRIQTLGQFQFVVTSWLTKLVGWRHLPTLPDGELLFGGDAVDPILSPENDADADIVEPQ